MNLSGCTSTTCATSEVGRTSVQAQGQGGSPCVPFPCLSKRINPAPHTPSSRKKGLYKLELWWRCQMAISDCRSVLFTADRYACIAVPFHEKVALSSHRDDQTPPSRCPQLKPTELQALSQASRTEEGRKLEHVYPPRPRKPGQEGRRDRSRLLVHVPKLGEAIYIRSPSEP